MGLLASLETFLSQSGLGQSLMEFDLFNDKTVGRMEAGTDVVQGCILLIQWIKNALTGTISKKKNINKTEHSSLIKSS